MRTWLKPFLLTLTALLGVSALWVWAAPLTGNIGKTVVLTETNGFDIGGFIRSNTLALHQLGSPPAASGALNDWYLYALSTGVAIRDPAGNITGPLGAGGGGGTVTTEKLPVQASSTGDVTLSNPGTAVFDGVTLTTGQRLLVRQQSTGSQNGIYLFATSSTALTRASDADTNGEFIDSFTVKVQSGTLYGGVTFYFANIGAFNLGTTTPTFAVQSWGTKAEILTNKSTVAASVPNGYVGTDAGGKAAYNRLGSYAAHAALAVGTTITPTALTMGIEGSGGAVDLTSSPQIAAGIDGQLLILHGTHATNTVKIDHGNGVRLCGNTGSAIVGFNGDDLIFKYNTTLSPAVWEELGCKTLQRIANVGRDIDGATTTGTAFRVGNITAGTYCRHYNSTVECFIAGATTDSIVQLSSGKNFIVKKSDLTTDLFKVSDAGTVTGLTVPRQILMSAWYPALSGGDCPTTLYWSPVGTNASATKEDTYLVLTGSRTVRNLRFQSLLNINASETRTVTVYKNGAASTLTCAVNGGAGTGTGELSDSTCANTANTVSVVAGDTLTIFAGCSGGTSAVPQAAVSIELE